MNKQGFGAGIFQPYLFVYSLEVIREIKVINHFRGNEKFCYIEAMEKAYDMAWKDESLMSIEVLLS